jgi:hypothetical protein
MPVSKKKRYKHRKQKPVRNLNVSDNSVCFSENLNLEGLDIAKVQYGEIGQGINLESEAVKAAFDKLFE